ncbi:unnamed protein product [Closterium sp. NIES-53]
MPSLCFHVHSSARNTPFSFSSTRRHPPRSLPTFPPSPPRFCAQYKLCRVRAQRVGDRGIPYIVTNDGRTIRYPDPVIKVNDTVKLDLESGKVVEHIHFDTGNICMVTGGRNRGRVGVMEHRERHKGSFDICHIKDAAGHQFATRLTNVFLIGQGAKPWLLLESLLLLCRPASFRLSVSVVTATDTGAGFASTFPDSIALVTTLQELSLNNIWNLTSLPEDFGQLIALEKLHLNNLHHLTHLPESLGQLTDLRELKIVECRQLQQLPDCLSQISSLEHLEIIKCPEIKVLPDDMGNGLHCLRYFHLKYCAALTHLPPSLSRLTALETLKVVEAIRLKGTLLDGFGCLTSLKELVLQDMPRLSTLPASFSGVSSLTNLELNNCRKVMVFPEGIERLEALQVVKIARMKGLKHLPASLVRLP